MKRILLIIIILFAFASTSYAQFAPKIGDYGVYVLLNYAVATPFDISSSQISDTIIGVDYGDLNVGATVGYNYKPPFAFEISIFANEYSTNNYNNYNYINIQYLDFAFSFLAQPKIEYRYFDIMPYIAGGIVLSEVNMQAANSSGEKTSSSFGFGYIAKVGIRAAISYLLLDVNIQNTNHITTASLIGDANVNSLALNVGVGIIF